MGKRGVIVFSFSGQKYGYASYGTTKADCREMRTLGETMFLAIDDKLTEICGVPDLAEDAGEKNIDWRRYDLRTCQTLHACAICGNDITLGQRYWDGGKGRLRAHETCGVRPENC
jgi:hypothetical protein